MKVYAVFYPRGAQSVFEMTAAAEEAYASGLRFNRAPRGRYSRTWLDICRDSADWPVPAKGNER